MKFMESVENFNIFQNLGDNPILSDVDTYIIALMSRISSAIALPNSGVLADSQIIIDIAQEVLNLNTYIHELKNGDSYEKKAYNSPECQKIENFLQSSLFPGAPSIVDAAAEAQQSDNYTDLAQLIWAMKDAGILTGTSGLMGQLQLFLISFPANQ